MDLSLVHLGSLGHGGLAAKTFTETYVPLQSTIDSRAEMSIQPVVGASNLNRLQENISDFRVQIKNYHRDKNVRSEAWSWCNIKKLSALFAERLWMDKILHHLTNPRRVIPLKCQQTMVSHSFHLVQDSVHPQDFPPGKKRRRESNTELTKVPRLIQSSFQVLEICKMPSREADRPGEADVPCAIRWAGPLTPLTCNRCCAASDEAPCESLSKRGEVKIRKEQSQPEVGAANLSRWVDHISIVSIVTHVCRTLKYLRPGSFELVVLSGFPRFPPCFGRGPLTNQNRGTKPLT